MHFSHRRRSRSNSRNHHSARNRSRSPNSRLIYKQTNIFISFFICFSTQIYRLLFSVRVLICIHKMYRTKSPGRQKLPTPRELSAQANAISAEKYKWEKYRYLFNTISLLLFIFIWILTPCDLKKMCIFE